MLLSLGQIESAQIKQAKSGFDVIALLPLEPGPAHPDDVQSKDRIPFRRHGERRQIFPEGRAALHHDEPADAHVLMKGGAAAEKGLVVHAHVARQETVVGDNHLIADGAIVTEMRAHHQEILVSHRGGAALGAAAMNCAILAKHIIVSDLNRCFPVVREGQVLWGRADDATRPDKVAGPDGDESLDNGVRLNDRAAADAHVRPDHRAGSYLGVRRDLGSGSDDCAGMNTHNTPASLKLK